MHVGQRTALRDGLRGPVGEIDLACRELAIAHADEGGARDQHAECRRDGEVAELANDRGHFTPTRYPETSRSTESSDGPGSARPATTSPSAVWYGVHTMRIAGPFGIGTVCAS